MSGIPAGAGSLLGKRLGKYEILALLALGGTAEIYLARIGGAAGFEKYVVVKCLHDHLADDTEFVKMFLDEARLAAHLDHSNIVQTMELGEHENRYYMVMEFLAGLSLAMIVRRAGERLPGGRIPVPIVLNMIAQSCAGLHYAHEKMMNGKPLNIVHRDISPQNLVVSFEGVVKVVDFGIAKAELRETQTRSGTIKGKFAYMSPEQCVAANVDRRTDIFALGVIAHELLTGRRLFKKPSPYETYQAVIECQVDMPSKMNVELDPALDPIIMKAVAKEKEKRYQTAEAFGDALMSYLHHRAKSSSPGDVARWIDASFNQEIEEHGARMRELIAGREFAADTNAGWSEEEEAEAAAERASRASMSDGMGAGSSNDDGNETGDDEIPADKTRIESNPLELLKELVEGSSASSSSGMPATQAAVTKPHKTPAPQLTKIPSITGPKPAQPAPRATPPGSIPSVVPGRKTPPPVVVAQAPTVSAQLPTPSAQFSAQMHAQQGPMPPTGPLRLPEPPLGPRASAAQQVQAQLAKVPSGKFPDTANMATVLHDDEKSTRETVENGRPLPPELASTKLAGEIVDPNRLDQMTRAAGPRGLASQAREAAASMGYNAVADPSARTSLEMQAPRPHSPSQAPVRGSIPSLPQQLPHSYPVMDSSMKDAVAMGANVFPGRPAHVPSSQFDRPGLDLQNRDSGELIKGPTTGPFDPYRAADLASPVGAGYPMQGDQAWADAAALPARALPPWKLAILFLCAIAGALVITIVIAKLIR